MLERFVDTLSRGPKTTRHWFERDGVLEDLVRNGRIPNFWDCGKTMLVVLPPEGVKPGDEYELQAGGAMEYFAPNGGPSRGRATLHQVSRRTAATLMQRKEITLRELEQ